MAKRKKQRTVTLSSLENDRQMLPLLLKNKFGQLGFVKWTCAFSPVLIVDPIQMVLAKCLPEGIYHAWFYKVQLYYHRDQECTDQHPSTSPKDSPTSQSTGTAAAAAATTATTSTPTVSTAEHLPVLIYWFGTSYEFSIVHQSQVIPWEEGCHRGYDQIPPFIQRRIGELNRPVPTVYALGYGAIDRLAEATRHTIPEERSLKIVSPRNKKLVVLNEWHALAMEVPPQQPAWVEQKLRLEAALPNKDLFGQIAFLPRLFVPGGSGTTSVPPTPGTGRMYHHPVLLLGPFRAPPGPVRTEWFHKCCSGEMIMVYWLGSYTMGRMQQNIFTFHRLSELVDYKKGKQKHYDEIPDDILQEYGDTNLPPKRLAAIDLWVCSQWELNQALLRKPEDRWGGLEDFEEDHDDDFDYYWECLNSAKLAANHRGSAQKTKNDKKSKVQARGKNNSTTIQIDDKNKNGQSRNGKRTVAEKDTSNGGKKQAQIKELLPPKCAPTTKQVRGIFEDSSSSVEGSNVDEKTTLREQRDTTQSFVRMNGTTRTKAGKKKNGAITLTKESTPNEKSNGDTDNGTDVYKVDVGGNSRDICLSPTGGKSKRLKLSLRESVARIETYPTVLAIPSNGTVGMPPLPPRSSPTPSDKDLDEQIQSNLRNCTTLLKKDSSTEARHSDDIKLPRKKKKKLVPIDKIRQQTKGDGYSTFDPTEQVGGMKSQKAETEQVVYDVIKQWTERNKGANSN